MRTWVRGAGIALALLLGFSRLPASGQQETVNLQFTLARGEALFYADSGEFDAIVELPNERQRTQIRSEARLAVRVLDVDSSGIMLVESVSEDLRLVAGGETEEPVDEPMLVKVRRDGRIVERVANAEGVEDFPYALPGRAVRVGEAWTRQGAISQAGFTSQGATTLTLQSIERVGTERVARVRYRTEGTMVPGRPPQPGTQVRLTGTMRVEGEFQWSVERGRPLRASSQMSIDVDSEVTAQGQTSRARAMVRATSRQEPIAAPGASQVPADQLIVPGRMVGAISFEMPISEVNTRLGSPESLPDGVGFRARGLAWSNGMVGYVDPANPARLVGLDVSLRRHRTDRGIAFGSSEGAVLFAYGAPPVRLDMMIPQTGGVRILIYNDLGIAFAVTSDAAHANLGPEHAPVGAVDWITIFPPGGAARIFPIP
ncbi:MAG: hypothetical protein ACRDGN_16720 [bacterium]